MPTFTSTREKRLWQWSLAIVIAIYATIGLARTLAEKVNDGGVFGVGLFMLGCLMVLATIITQGFRIRPKSGAEIAVALGVAASYLLVLVRMAIPTERSHLIEYSVLAIFIFEALRERISHGRKVPMPSPLLAILLTTLVGVIDEGIQAFVPGRVFDPQDMLFNFLAAVMAVTASVVLDWVRRQHISRIQKKGN